MTSEESPPQANSIPHARLDSQPERDHENIAATTDKTDPGADRGATKPLQESQNVPSGSADVQAPTCGPASGVGNKQPPLASGSAQAAQRPGPSLEQQLAKAKRDLESMVIKYAKSESDNLLNKNKIDELERKLKRTVKDNDSLANRVKLLTNDKNHLSETLSAKVAQLTVLEQKNCSASNDQKSRLSELEARQAELEARNAELLGQIDTYKSKEADLLDFSERLSMKQLLLQTELDKALENVPDYKAQYEQLVAAHGQLGERAEGLAQQLALANSNLEAERTRNARLTEQCAELELKCRRQTEELENELKLVRRKCQVATKELLRRIRQYEPEQAG